MARYVEIRGQGGATRSVKVGGNGLSEGALRQAVDAGKWALVEPAPAPVKAEPKPELVTEDEPAEAEEAPKPKRGRPRKAVKDKESTDGNE